MRETGHRNRQEEDALSVEKWKTKIKWTKKGLAFHFHHGRAFPNNVIASLIKHFFPRKSSIDLGSKQLLQFTVEF